MTEDDCQIIKHKKYALKNNILKKYFKKKKTVNGVTVLVMG